MRPSELLAAPKRRWGWHARRDSNPHPSAYETETLERSLPSVSLDVGHPSLVQPCTRSKRGPDSPKAPGAEILGLPNSSVDLLSYGRTTLLCADSDGMVNKPAND